MHKPELVSRIAERADIEKDQAGRFLEALISEISNAVARKDKVTLVGFGTFEQRHRGARQGVNPQTKEPVMIRASNTVAFTPGKGLKDAIAQ